MIHDLQQDVVDVGMRLLDLVEQDDAVGMGPHRVDQQPALLEADVAGRRANQPRHRVLLHVLAHVEADEFVAELQRQLLRELGLADAGRTGEQEAAGRAFRLAEAGARALDGLRDEMDRLVLPEDHALQRLFERSQPLAIGRGRLSRGNARHPRDDRLDVGGVDRQRVVGRRTLEAHDRAGLVDEVDRAVGQADSRAGGAPRASPPPRARRRVYFTR